MHVYAKTADGVFPPAVLHFPAQLKAKANIRSAYGDAGIFV
jgi:hypothetical protein